MWSFCRRQKCAYSTTQQSGLIFHPTSCMTDIWVWYIFQQRYKAITRWLSIFDKKYSIVNTDILSVNNFAHFFWVHFIYWVLGFHSVKMVLLIYQESNQQSLDFHYFNSSDWQNWPPTWWFMFNAVCLFSKIFSQRLYTHLHVCVCIPVCMCTCVFE